MKMNRKIEDDLKNKEDLENDNNFENEDDRANYQERFCELHSQCDWDVRTPPLQLYNNTF